jgi:hypothetical protein
LPQIHWVYGYFYRTQPYSLEIFICVADSGRRRAEIVCLDCTWSDTDIAPIGEAMAAGSVFFFPPLFSCSLSSLHSPLDNSRKGLWCKCIPSEWQIMNKKKFNKMHIKRIKNWWPIYLII